MSSVTEERYLDAVDAFEGWCKKCKEFTRDMTEPDAEDYDCPECECDSVVGAEQGLLLGEFDIE